MTSVRQTIWTLALAVVALAVAGCNAWTPSTPWAHADTGLSALSSEKPPTGPGNSQAVVRGQDYPASDRLRTNPVESGPDDHSRYPMPASGALAEQAPRSSSVAQAQYTAPPPDPSSLWSSYGQGQPSRGGLWSSPSRPSPSSPPASAPSRSYGPAAPSRGLPGTLPPPPGTAASPSTALPPATGTWPAPAGSLPSSPSPSPPMTGQPPAVPPMGLPQSPAGTQQLTTPPGAAVPDRYADVVVNVQETQTGRIMLGAGVNSNLGVTGQIIIDERNFDWRRFPTSVDDILNGKAFRGAGQGFRIEALPGREVQRYMLQFTEPYLGGTRVSLNLSGFLYDRRFFDWDEQRLGGRFGMGYRLTPDLSLSVGVRGEKVDLTDPRVPGVPELEAALGKSDLYMGQVTLTHDTRDVPFAPTEGHLLELNLGQAFGTFDYPRGEIDYRRYFLLSERVDGSGRHVLGFSTRFGFTGSQTPIYENYFAGGYSTIRGFDYREASPKVKGVVVGGEFLMLGSLEYLFPITADDMLKGVLFTDFGTVEEQIEFNAENYRVTLGAGLRIFIPAMGPAPIALDFGVPVAHADTDGIQNFSFFIGVGR